MPQVKNRIARNGLEAAVKAKPAAFFTPEFASLVTAGNFDDDLAKIKDCDLIIEAVVENLEIKRSLLRTCRTTSPSGFDRRFKHQRYPDPPARRRTI